VARKGGVAEELISLKAKIRKGIVDRINTMNMIIFLILLIYQFKTLILRFIPTFDEFIKSQNSPVFVIPANAGIQGNQPLLDFRLRGFYGFGDFLPDHQQPFFSPKFRIRLTGFRAATR